MTDKQFEALYNQIVWGVTFAFNILVVICLIVFFAALNDNKNSEIIQLLKEQNKILIEKVGTK
jgi:hypothetical protein